MISKLFQANNIYPLHFKLYTITGFWKIDSKSKYKKFLYNLFHFITATAGIFIMLAETVDAYLVRNDIEKLSTNLCSNIAITAANIRMWILNFEKKRVEQMHVNLDNNLNLVTVGNSERDQKIFEKYSKELAKITVVFYAIAMPCSFFWMIFPMLESAEKRRFPIAFPNLPKMKESPRYEIIYAYLVVILLITPNSVLSYDLIVYGFYTRIRAHYEILIENFRKIGDLYRDNDYGNIYGDLKDFKVESGKVEYTKWRCEETMRIIKENIVHHAAILKAVKEIDNIYKGPVMVITAGCTALIGVEAYEILTVTTTLNLQFMQRLSYVGCAIFDLFFYCYYGTQIEEMSYQVKEAVYDLPWYEMEKAPKKLIMLIIDRLRTAPKITTLGIIPMTLRTFLELMKISYNMIAVLRETKSKND